MKIVDENDGKSSDDFMRRLKELSMGISTNFTSTTHNIDYAPTGEKKKSVGFGDTFYEPSK